MKKLLILFLLCGSLANAINLSGGISNPLPISGTVSVNAAIPTYHVTSNVTVTTSVQVVTMATAGYKILQNQSLTGLIYLVLDGTANPVVGSVGYCLYPGDTVSTYTLGKRYNAGDNLRAISDSSATLNIQGYN